MAGWIFPVRLLADKFIDNIVLEQYNLKNKKH